MSNMHYKYYITMSSNGSPQIYFRQPGDINEKKN